jgi:hypothetical protein
VRTTRRFRARLLTGAGIGAVLLVTGIGVHLWSGRATDEAPVARTAPVATATVERTDLATTLTVSGQLGYGTEHPVKAGTDGQVTWLPKFGGTVTRGEPLFRVDDQPVALFYGRTPLFRRLDGIGLVGRDVKVVADNLRALGYSIGNQPAVGSLIRQPATSDENSPPSADTSSTITTPTAAATDPAGPGRTPTPIPAPRIAVRPGDAVLTTSLRAALRRWQRDIGATPTGVLEIGSVVVQPQRIRVSSLTGQLGDPADSPLISVTRTAKVVTVSLKADEMESVRGAKQVTITLPSGDRVKGRISSISRVVVTPDGQDDAPTATATITVTRASTIKNLDSAPVQVDLIAEARTGVLAVPVGALLALSEGGYAVQVQGGGLVPVTVGLFAMGMVEINGDRLDEGTAVVTTS